MKTHHFLAVPIDEKNRAIIHKWIVSNKDKYPFKSWVHPEDYHITLAFLGNVGPSSKLVELVKNVGEVVEHIKQFEISLKGIEIFGKLESPRIFWAGVENSPSLHQLQEQVVNACEKVGFQLDRKPFRPHITMARKWKSEESFLKSPELDNVFDDEASPILVNKIHLYQTHLDRIPKYEAVNVFPLFRS